jgi:2,4-dienoyl-CoA reductase-like NADH-dependent reductase (Old Yellow Enzyme family)
MTDLAQQPLLTPFRMGELLLPNRIVMAPLTRQRAANSGHVPALLQAQYYAQRASAGVIISEGTAISPEGYGWVDTPGLWSEEQVSGWRVVTDAVHEADGRIVAQLWHTGVKMDRERGNRLIAEGLADLIAFGRPYIANPDLVARFATNAPLNNDIKSETIYGSGPEGYVDYPDMKQVAESAESSKG